MITTQSVLIALSVLIAFISVGPYIAGILRGKTKPNLVTWFTWTLLGVIATAAELVAGEYVTAILTGAEALMTSSVVVLGLRYGHTRYTFFDAVCQLGALTGLVLWLVFDSPVIAVLASVTIDFVGTLPTFWHAWKSPKEEKAQAYGISAISDGLGLLALPGFNFVSATYIVYNFAVDILLTLIIVARRPQNKVVHAHHRRVLNAESRAKRQKLVKK